MKTELLNEYIFGKMVADFADEIKMANAKLMAIAGASKEEMAIATKAVTHEELCEALNILTAYKNVAAQLLQESLSEPPK